jgi:hypothetical protein
MSRATIKPDRKGNVEETIARLKSQTIDLPGVKYWITVLSDAGELTVIGLYGTKLDRQETASVNTTRWADAQELFLEAPTIVEGEVLAFVRND